jgi:hypothetical protein
MLSTRDLFSCLGSGADQVVQFVASLAMLIFSGRSILTASLTD